MSFWKYVVVCAFQISVVLAAKLPDYIHPCHQSDENLTQCIIERSKEVIPEVSKGIDYLDVPKLSPFLIATVNLTAGENLTFKLVNLTITGLDRAKVLNVSVDVQKRHIWAKLYFPNLDFDGSYSIDGKILILPINGHGPARVIFDDVYVEFDTDYNLEKKDGDEYAKIKNLKIDYNLKRSHYKLDNLFNGDKLLGDQMNKFVNENWEALHKDFSPYISKTIEDIVSQLFALFTDAIPFAKILLP